jgi:hypothetical protein
MKNVHEKIYNDIIYGAKLITKINEIIIAVKIMLCVKMSFFANNSKIINILAKTKIKININNNNFIKFQSNFN